MEISTFHLYKYFVTFKGLQLFHSSVLQQITKFSIVYELLEKKNNFTFICIRKTHMQKYATILRYKKSKRKFLEFPFFHGTSSY